MVGALSDLREPQRTERSGVPIWWSEAPGEVTASICFRVGRSDESLGTRGITHLVEHLALFPIGRPEYGYNGFVDDGMAAFYAWGELDEVCGFLRSCAANLAALPLERLETERRVLRREADGFDPGLAARLLNHRFGARGWGLGVFRELGLRWLGPDDVERWAAERFVAGNAVVWMTAEPPADFELGLPEGAWHAPVEPEPLPFRLPAHVHDGTGGVVVSTWGPRSRDASAGIRLAGERLQERLRREQGLTYSAYGDVESYGGHWRHGMLGADCADRDAERVREEIWRVVSELAEDGPSEAELERYVRAVRRFYVEPDALRAHLAYLAHDELHRFRVTSSATAVERLEALTPGAVAEATSALLESAIMLSPDTLRAPLAGFHPRDVPPPPPVEGRTFRSERREGRQTVADLIHIADEGMTLEPAAGERTTIRWAEAAGWERRPARSVRLHAFDESWIEIGPDGVEDGEAAMDLIRERLDHLPLVPSIAAANEERLSELVETSIGERPVARAELPFLWDELDEEEDVLLLAQAANDGRTGLLALTADRVLWSTAEGEPPQALGRLWTALTGAELRKRLLAADRLALAEEGGGELVFEGFQPAEAAGRAAELAAARIEAVRPAT